MRRSGVRPPSAPPNPSVCQPLGEVPHEGQRPLGEERLHQRLVGLGNRLDQQKYLRKRGDYFDAGVNLLEIDSLTEGQRVLYRTRTSASPSLSWSARGRARLNRPHERAADQFARIVREMFAQGKQLGRTAVTQVPVRHAG